MKSYLSQIFCFRFSICHQQRSLAYDFESLSSFGINPPEDYLFGGVFVMNETIEKKNPIKLYQGYI